ncbi:hypothetical protein FACS1894109_04750 [Spirochaetia bacterium]|nr:hypothetical protein FACS1894109_04750 [Spirochaetia bacterium]
MKNSNLRIIGLACILAITCLPLFAGGGAQSGKGAAVNEKALLNPVGQLPLLKEKVTLTMGIVRNSQVTDFALNYMTQQLEKDSNIHIEFVYYGSTSQEAAQKLELQIMAGGSDLPDIINFELDGGSINYYGEQGMLLPLESYIKNSAYFMNAGIAEMPFDPWQYIRAPDGHTYSLIKYQAAFETELCSRVYFNTAWLKELGLSMPTTTREFENTLRAFKNHRFNNDGKKEYQFIDVRGNMVGERFIAPLVGPYVYIGEENGWFYKEPNGTLAPVYTTDKWREALTWIRGMVDEGLIDPLSFTQDAEQLKAIAGSTNGYAWGSSTYYPLNYMSADDPRASTWELMGPLAGPNGGAPVPSYSAAMPYNYWVVTKNCKYPEAAFRLGDLLMSEKYSVMSRFGEEGPDWKKPEGGAQSYFADYPPYLNPILPWGQPQNKNWSLASPHLLTYKIMNGMAVKGEVHFIDLWNAEAASRARPYFNANNSIGSIVYTSAEREQINEIRSNAETYFKECYTRFLLRDMSLENDWNKYLAELKAIGLDTYVRVANTAYARMQKK